MSAKEINIYYRKVEKSLKDNTFDDIYDQLKIEGYELLKNAKNVQNVRNYKKFKKYIRECFEPLMIEEGEEIEGH
jgi:hypothetical protein